MTDSFDASRYRVTIQAVEEDGDRFLRGTVAELPNVAVFGDSYAEVASEVLEVIGRLREMAVAQGKAFPQPHAATTEFSGRVTLRVPKALHARMADCATSDEVSLNTWIVTALGVQVGEHCAEHRLVEVVKFAKLFTVAQSAKRVDVGASARPDGVRRKSRPVAQFQPVYTQ